MSGLAVWLAGIIRERIAGAAGESSTSTESRLIFHGPPLEILAQVYDDLLTRDMAIGFPVLLQVPGLTPGTNNPPIGASGWCDESHLLDLRNSPTSSSYLALVPPGQNAIRSVTSTTDEFGLAVGVDGGNVPFDSWWADTLVQRAVAAALDAANLSEADRGHAEYLVHRSARAFDEVDPEKSSRRGAWRLISRLFAIGTSNLPDARAVSLACGVPPMEGNRLSPGEQQASIDGVASVLSDGFRTGLDAPMEEASEVQKSWLEAFLSHIRETCDVPTALERAPEAFYAPACGLDLISPPAWWLGLTVEVWNDLLSDEPEIVGDIRLECRNPLLPPSRGTPLLVQSNVELVVLAGEENEPVDVVLERSPGKNTNGFPMDLPVEAENLFTDAIPPRHRSPLQYKASAEKHRPASIKVVSLADWAPGIFIACRLARKVTPPKAPVRRARGVNFETSLSLPGPGLYELLVFLSPKISVSPIAIGTVSSEGSGFEETQELAVREIQVDRHQVEVAVEGSCQVDITFERESTSGKPTTEVCRVFLSCDEVAEEGCRSEFERLIKLNRRQIDPGGAKLVVHLNRSVRTSSLQGWMLQEGEVARSFLPIVLAEDYSDHWLQPRWSEETGRILSSGRFLQDPRPPASHFQPPPGFIEAREGLARLIRGEDDQFGLIEAAQLGEWLLRGEDFPSLIEQYLDAYASWVKASPEIAKWVDVVAISSLEPGGRTLSRVPDAIALSPLHPLRMAWHALAQGVLDLAATSNLPCPAAGILDPSTVPDMLRMPLISPEGIEYAPFLSVECNSDYWSVLWNGGKLSGLAKRSKLEPFGPALGLSIGGISSGFSASQVSRALDDVSNVLCAKSRISVVVSSAGGATDSCNDGLVRWSTARHSAVDPTDGHYYAGLQRLDVFDTREEGSRPDEATIANLSEDTGNRVRWYAGHPKDIGLDLGIIAQLDSAEPDVSETTVRTALGAGGLIRYRVRRQLPGSFLSESRQSGPAELSGDALADKIAACITNMEGGADRPTGLRFAPDVNSITEMLEEKKTDFVAVSSSAVDPACFLGGWLRQSYLWDYDLPSYSHRAGDTSGYYLLSRVKSSDRDGLRKVLSRLPNCASLSDREVETILLEVARRGIPTIRGLAGDDTGATGDLGLFIAARLLQDRFRLGACLDSLRPVVSGGADQPELTLVVPVDPFRGYLDDLSRSLNKEHSDLSLARPDLLVVGISLRSGNVRIHLTPVEVKCRLGSVFPQGDIADAIGQAKSLGRLLEALSSHKEALSVWRIAYQHLLLSIIGFGMRVYSQHQDLASAPGDWAVFHERIAGALLGDPAAVTVDNRGRLVIVDDTTVSDALDRDRDGFPEIIVVGVADAGRIVASDAQSFYNSVRAKVGDWELGASWPAFSPTPVTGPGTNLDVAEPAMPAEIRPAEFAEDVVAGGGTRTEPVEQEDGGISLRVGSTVDGFEQREISLALSDTRLNQLNIGVVGDLGTGKTQLLKSLVYQISTSAASNRAIQPRILIFDYKRDYSQPDFVNATGARVVKPYRLPLNLFDTSGAEGSLVPWLDRFRFFADVLDKIYSGIGPVQRDKLKRAVRAAYNNQPGGVAPTIYDIHTAYAHLLDGKSDSPMAIIDDLVDMEIFEPDPSKTSPFDAFMDGVVVVSLDALGQDDRSKNMLVAVMLNMFYENMLRLPKRPFMGTSPQLRVIDSYLLVDEADNIMRYEFDVLRKLLLQGREFGCGVILASQYLRHFKVNATDYREPLLTWFVHKVPNITAAELGALGLAGTAGELAERVKALPKHRCLYKSFDGLGQIIGGLPFYELIPAANQADG